MSGWDVTVIRVDHISIGIDEAKDADTALELARELGCTCPAGTQTYFHTEIRPAP